MEPTDVAASINAILTLALTLTSFSSLVTIGLTGFFKQQFPKSSPFVFSVVCGAVVTGVSYLAITALPDSLLSWMTFVLISIVGGLVPSGLFDAGVNLIRKAQARSWSVEE